MAHSVKPTVWIEARKSTTGYSTHRVLFERDGERFPGLMCGPNQQLAKRLKAKLDLILWERDATVERLIAEMRAAQIPRERFAADLITFLAGAAAPLRFRTAAESVTVGQWRDEYLAVCREQNRPGAVANFDEPAVNGFSDFLGLERLLSTVTQDDARSWKAQLFDRGGKARRKKDGSQRAMPLGKTTVRMRLGHASAGFAWARKRGWIEVNPFDAVERPPAQKHDRVLTGEEIKLIYAEILPANHWGWFTTLLYTGLRREELVSLSKPQVLTARTASELWRLKFAAEQTKNKKAKVVELHPDAQPSVAAALEASKGAQVFEGLTLSKIQHWFERITARLGRVTPHTLKHTFCTRFMEGTGDLDALVLLTGNSRRSLELHYIHLSRPRSRVILGLDFGASPPVLPQIAVSATLAARAGVRQKI